MSAISDPFDSNLDVLMRAYRSAYPRARNYGAIKLHKNTSATRQDICIFCGEVGPSCSNKWRPTVRYLTWREAHDCWSALTRKQIKAIIHSWKID